MLESAATRSAGRFGASGALLEGKPLVWEDPWHTPAPGSFCDEAGDHHPGADLCVS